LRRFVALIRRPRGLRCSLRWPRRFSSAKRFFLALEANLEVRLAPSIGEGMRVRIKAGPLQGLEGWVEKRYGMETVLLRLDFINQAAAVKLGAELLDPV